MRGFVCRGFGERVTLVSLDAVSRLGREGSVECELCGIGWIR